MVRIIALVLSVVFQPLLMPTLVFGVLFFAVPQATTLPEVIKLRLFYLVTVATLLIPMVLMIGMRWSGLVRSLHFEELKDRRVPFLIITLFYLLTTLFLQQKSDLNPILWQGMGVMTVAVAFLTAVSFFWKMSAHMTGLGGLLAVVWVMGSYFSTFSVVYLLLLSLGLSGIVASSRLYLDAHRPVEVYAGLLVGFIICWLGFSWIYS